MSCREGIVVPVGHGNSQVPSGRNSFFVGFVDWTIGIWAGGLCSETERPSVSRCWGLQKEDDIPAQLQHRKELQGHGMYSIFLQYNRASRYSDLRISDDIIMLSNAQSMLSEPL